MVSAGQVAAFAVASFIVIAIPGPSVLFVVGRALAYGRRTALASVTGNAAGLEVVAACVALGIGTLVERSALVFIVVKLAGAGYLIWLGIRAVRQRRGMAFAFAAAPAPYGQRRAMLEGFVVGVANPKAVILFAAVLPQFVNRRGRARSGADAAAQPGVLRDRPGLRQRLGPAGQHRAGMVRLLPAAPAAGQPGRRSGDDRAGLLVAVTRQ